MRMATSFVFASASAASNEAALGSADRSKHALGYLAQRSSRGVDDGGALRLPSALVDEYGSIFTSVQVDQTKATGTGGVQGP